MKPKRTNKSKRRKSNRKHKTSKYDKAGSPGNRSIFRQKTSSTIRQSIFQHEDIVRDIESKIDDLYDIIFQINEFKKAVYNGTAEKSNIPKFMTSSWPQRAGESEEQWFKRIVKYLNKYLEGFGRRQKWGELSLQQKIDKFQEARQTILNQIKKLHKELNNTLVKEKSIHKTSPKVGST